MIYRLSKTGLTILLVEQNIYQALEISERGYVIKNGRVFLEGRADALLANRQVQESYLH